MKAIVDTSVWSLALRRTNNLSSPYKDLLLEVIQDGRAVLMGIVRQEILSGIKFAEQFEKLKKQLHLFPDLPVEIEDYETAARFYNACMAKGVRGSHADFLICACAYRRKHSVLTVDPDFKHYQKYIPLSLLQPET